MKTISLIETGGNQTLILPKEFEFKGISELEISKEGDAIVLRPVRKKWLDYAQAEKTDMVILIEREDTVD